MVRRGFTIVELLIVITVMAILLTLGVVNLRGTQVQARDDQRKGDIQTIASNLEVFYTNGTATSSSIGRYPSTAMITTGSESAIISNIQLYLPNIDTKVLIAPGETTVGGSFFAATNNTATTSGVTPQPDNSNYSFIYQPLQSDGTLCMTEAQECRKYNLYYKTETNNTVVMVTSKNQ